MISCAIGRNRYTGDILRACPLSARGVLPPATGRNESATVRERQRRAPPVSLGLSTLAALCAGVTRRRRPRVRRCGFALLSTLCLGLVAAFGSLLPAHTDASNAAFVDQQAIFFPFVPNGVTLEPDNGPWYGTAIVQNLEAYPIEVVVRRPGSTARVTSVPLDPYGAVTLSASELGIDNGTSGAAYVTASWTAEGLATLRASGLCHQVLTSLTRTRRLTRSATDTTDTLTVSLGTGESLVQAPVDVLTAQADGRRYLPEVDYSVTLPEANTLAISWTADARRRPEANASYEVQYTVVRRSSSCPEPRISGAIKVVSPTPPTNAQTSAAMRAVTGYTAVPLADLARARGLSHDASLSTLLTRRGQSAWAFPLVQTNNGWNTVVHVTNFSTREDCPVTLTFLEAGAGTEAPAPVTSSLTLSAGQTISIDLVHDLDFPTGMDRWVGQAWLTADCTIAASVDRLKGEANLALSLTAQPRDLSNTSPQYAPLLFESYYGWNTGVTFANLSDSQTNQVTLTFLDESGEILQTITRTLAPQAVEYLYRPATDQVPPDTSTGRLQQLVVTGTAPFAAVADSVKYEGERGQALSYPLEHGGSLGDVLSLPLIQKGSASPTGGHFSGDTSGIRLFNASPTEPATIAYEFRLADGTEVPTGQHSATLATIAPMGTLLLYTPFLPELPEGFQGSFLAEVRAGGPVSVISNTVNYDVPGDGSVAYPAFAVPAHQPVGGAFLALPESATNPVSVDLQDGETLLNRHTVAVVVFDQYGRPDSDARVCVDIVDGPNRGASDDATRQNCGNADQTGQFLFRYLSNGTLGTDSIRVWVDLNQDGVTDTNEIATVHKTWVRGLSRELSLQQQTCQPELSNRSQGRCVNLIGTTHRLTVRFIDGTGLPIPGVLVRAATDRGGTLEPTLSCSATGRDGRADCSYTRTTPGTDRIVIWADLDRDGERGGDEPWLATTKSWVQPQLFLTPDCEELQDLDLTCFAAPRSELRIAVRVTGPGGSPGVSGVLVRGRIVSGVNGETPDLACTATGADGRATCTLRDQRANVDNSHDEVRIWADLNADGVEDPWEPQQRFFVAWQFQFQITATHRDVVPISTFDEAFVNLRNEYVTITATVTSLHGTPVPGVPVFFTVEDGPNAGLRVECGHTDQHGQARCTYRSEEFGVDGVFVVFDLDASGHRSLADEVLARYLAWSADLTIEVQCPGGILYDGVCHAATGRAVTVSMTLVDGAGPVEGVRMYCHPPGDIPLDEIPPDLPQVPSEQNTSTCAWNPDNIRTSPDGTTVVTVSSQSDGVFPHLIWADLVEDGQRERWEPRQWFAMAYCPSVQPGERCTSTLRAESRWSAASDSAALSGISVSAAALVPSSSNETQRPRTRRGG